jgi:hypothetical protein
MKYILLCLLGCACTTIWPFAERVAQDIEAGEADRDELPIK